MTETPKRKIILDELDEGWLIKIGELNSFGTPAGWINLGATHALDLIYILSDKLGVRETMVQEIARELAEDLAEEIARQEEQGMYDDEEQDDPDFDEVGMAELDDADYDPADQMPDEPEEEESEELEPDEKGQETEESTPEPDAVQPHPANNLPAAHVDIKRVEIPLARVRADNPVDVVVDFICANTADGSWLPLTQLDMAKITGLPRGSVAAFRAPLLSDPRIEYRGDAMREYRKRISPAEAHPDTAAALKKAEANAKAEIDRKVENINKRIMDELLKLIEEISARSGTNVFEVTAAGLARKVNNLAETNVMPMLLKLEERKEITVKASRGGSVVVTLLGKRAA
jgi:hypothetical protein